MHVLTHLFTAVAIAVAALPAAAQDASDTSSSAAIVLDKSKKKPNENWEKAVARFRSEETTAPRGGIVLLGDSITTRWPVDMYPGENVINRGIGGDHIGGWHYLGLIDRLDTSVSVLEPKQVYLMIGVNDMLDNGPPMENMKAAYALLLDELQKAAPEAEIIVQSILPVRKEKFDYMEDNIIELNQEIERLATARGMHYIDLHSRFEDENKDLRKELTNDGVHLTPRGYELWLDILAEEGLVDAEDTTSTLTSRQR